eukprot:TRINITY_DN1983_c0_g1_i12.p1 TRINITY_DN1983_c0_g1~~TRINITY_DN1983_c0_g1_i12.p1  ORF type:complete len:735 (-),score=58.08 TRINITY_DN1983_c0_g1_i12:153-2117(-)
MIFEDAVNYASNNTDMLALGQNKEEELGEEVLLYVPKLPYIIQYANTRQFGKVDFLYLMESFFGYPLIDRTHTLNTNLKVKVLDAIPEFDYDFSKSLNQICLERAQEIMDIANTQNKKIQILWSGGIDSTAVIIAFLTLFPEEVIKNKLEVLYTEASIQEYPEFKDSICPSYVNFTLLDDFVFPLTFQRSNDLIVTGEHGDQIFGSDILKWCMGPPKFPDGTINELFNKIDEPWQEVVLKLLVNSRAIPEGSEHAWLHWIYQQVQKAPIPIQTTFDFFWWLNFSMKWQNVSLRMFTKALSVDQSTYLRLLHFYRTDDFQQWSFHNHDYKLPNRTNWASYKLPLKQFIFNYTSDENYYNNKEKIQSLKLGQVLKIQGVKNDIFNDQIKNMEGRVALDSNFNFIKWGKTSLCLDILNIAYGKQPLIYLLKSQNISYLLNDNVFNKQISRKLRGVDFHLQQVFSWQRISYEQQRELLINEQLQNNLDSFVWATSELSPRQKMFKESYMDINDYHDISKSKFTFRNFLKILLQKIGLAPTEWNTNQEELLGIGFGLGGGGEVVSTVTSYAAGAVAGAAEGQGSSGNSRGIQGQNVGSFNVDYRSQPPPPPPHYQQSSCQNVCALSVCIISFVVLLVIIIIIIQTTYVYSGTTIKTKNA